MQGTEKDSAWNILSRMKHYMIKGVSVAIVHNYKIEWAKGYGWADENARIPVTPETPSQAASISKSLNAVGVLRLAQENKLNMLADINQYLTTWKFPYDTKSEAKKYLTSNYSAHGGTQRGRLLGLSNWRGTTDDCPDTGRTAAR